MPTLSCDICNGTFESPRKTTRYCSTKCRNSFHHAKRKNLKPVISRSCQLCGADISDLHRVAAYCVECPPSVRRKARLRSDKESVPRKCDPCGADISMMRNDAKSCSAQCRARSNLETRAKAAGRPTPKVFRSLDFCAHCGCSMERKPRRSYCSPQCVGKAAHLRKLATRSEMQCASPYCTVIHRQKNGGVTCSAECMYVLRAFNSYGDASAQSRAIHFGKLSACRVKFQPCPSCNAWVALELQAPTKYCAQCKRRIELDRATRKTHARRAAGFTCMTVHEIAERDGTRCHICHHKVNMGLSGMNKWGPTVEHITPVSMGGTNDPTNTVLAHRHCNVSRGNRQPSQMVLVA